MEENQHVQVTFPSKDWGAKEHTLTVAQVRDRWKDQPQDWQDKFFTDLEQGEATSMYGARYTLVPLVLKAYSDGEQEVDEEE